MQESIDQLEYKDQKPLILSERPRFIETILNWLTGKNGLTKEELEDSGVYHGYQQD